ncbi:serine protease, S1-C subfamily, contains C-terminal PDZ domain [Malonomonas rubra DSM 5091]|uniref:Serine protease, S1-C subfamily, contains C-terminal PDZ domain n=1 Tax=Malonomonas rubra DSM 5091 TaxID=1122189 RepID=A0A1M6BX19_MALRU|nr:trypsin-like peptidase domain-containing protein [Malonomonas rubra]SHI53074.1 serine protease, S1-C subfamily, contains C-terminal PDZ domain [Malonomonas rubra DSM 5091]
MFVRCFLVLILLLLPLFSANAAERRTPVVEAIAKARDAVVNIRTEEIVQRRSTPFFGFGDSIFEQFFNDMLPPRSYKTQSLGSGVIISADGHILTNAHVVEKASKIFVALPERNKELEARLIGIDGRIDLAVLKIEEKGTYPFLQPARSDDLMLGESVIAIGNPLGLGHSITTGIISSTKRQIQIADGFSSVFIQTDALINPGNSGGPLININGELVGINTAIARQAQGIGFSIPIDTAKRVLNDLIDYGKVRHVFLGIIPVEVSSSFTRSRGDGGVLIEELLEDSPAEKAGFQIADVVLAIDGVPIASIDEYYSLLQTYTPDDTLDITLLRGLKEQQKKVRLTSLPKGYELSYTRRTFGFTLKQGRRGVLIDEVVDDSPADKIGLQRGDGIAKVAGIEIEKLTDFETVIGEKIGRLPLSFLVVRNNRGYLIELP